MDLIDLSWKRFVFWGKLVQIFFNLKVSTLFNIGRDVSGIESKCNLGGGGGRAKPFRGTFAHKKDTHKIDSSQFFDWYLH